MTALKSRALAASPQVSFKTQVGLRRWSKWTCGATLFLIFAGSLVTSTGSGLAVPDWPLSYGMVFPPMVGGVFYEHGHRMVASTVGLMTLIQAVWLGIAETRSWVKKLGFFALGAVILQGVLGGITVLFFLPTAVSVIHGILAQTFFILTILIAYGQSIERRKREDAREETPVRLVKLSVGMAALIYIQLIIGALMRHTHSGLAIPDFPTMGGFMFPHFDDIMLQRINDMRFYMNLDPVTIGQVAIHFVHRVFALLIVIYLGVFTWLSLKSKLEDKTILMTIFFLNALIVVQVFLGIFTVLSAKAPYLTSFHVVCGAATLGMSVLLALRMSPLKYYEWRSVLGLTP